jgi:hypothetical protein
MPTWAHYRCEVLQIESFSPRKRKIDSSFFRFQTLARGGKTVARKKNVGDTPLAPIIILLISLASKIAGTENAIEYHSVHGKEKSTRYF